jgi:N-methylhydantoinase B
VESIEQISPYLLVESFGLIADSCGAGEFNGGLGLYRRFIIQEDGVALSLYSDHFSLPAGGRQGGHDGGLARLRVFRDKQIFELDAMSRFPLERGDIVEIRVSGGGGWGDPRRRSKDAIAADVADGLISPEFAAREYGWRTVVE